jgi:hypothetical protein
MAEQYSIRRGVPVPQAIRLRLNGSKYPFSYMQPKDMFEVPVPEGRNANKVRGAVYAACKKYQKTTGTQFTTRVLSDRVVGVWRVK